MYSLLLVVQNHRQQKHFLVISLIISTLVCLHLLIMIITHYKCSSSSILTIVTIAIAHFFSFLSGIFGFPLGMSCALYNKDSSVSLNGVLAIIAIFVNMFSASVSYQRTEKSESNASTIVPYADDVETQNLSTQPSMSVAQYHTNEDLVNTI